MQKEIERKFLAGVSREKFIGYKSTIITQGYLSFDGTEIRVRMRAAHDLSLQCTMTLKRGAGVTREEFEFNIAEEVANGLISMAEPYVIRKTRYEVGRWEVDFFDDNVSEPIAEIELTSEDEKLPYAWLGFEPRGEVTHDPAFLNRNIALRVGSEALADAGYHLRHIPKGVLGQPSKIREELEELEDATIQGNRILQLVELSDIVGAVKHFAGTIGTTLEECVAMADATERAFKAGVR